METVKHGQAQMIEDSRIFNALGWCLFLFIPFVLFLFVQHPRPIALSLIFGVAIMFGHKFLARPYMRQVREKKCLWCNRTLGDLEFHTIFLKNMGKETLETRFCTHHKAFGAKFFNFTYMQRHILRMGIFFPLTALLGAMMFAVFGYEKILEPLTFFFKLCVGLSVNWAAFGYLLTRDKGDSAQTVFPLHNFYLIGIRNILWLFRVIGVYWVYQGLHFFLL